MNRRAEQPENTSDERLLAAFMQGDEGAFGRLVERYTDDVFQFAVRFVRTSAAAEDVVQETFLQVYHSAGSFDSERRFRPWLLTIAANKARDQLRTKARRREVPLAGGGSSEDQEKGSYLDFLSDGGPPPGVELEAVELSRVVGEIISGMPEHLREILVLGYYRKHPYKEIAEILGIPLGTVKSRLHAAVAHFAAAYRRALQRGGGG